MKAKVRAATPESVFFVKEKKDWKDEI